MASGPGDGDQREGKEPRETERRRTPPPRRRTSSVEHRSGRRETTQGSIFGRLFGRQGLDAALEERFKPYDYQSSRPLLRWVFLALLGFIAAGAFALFADLQFRSQVNEWQDEGLNEIPIDNEEVSAASLVIAALTPDLNTAEALCSAETDALNATPTPDVENPDATPDPDDRVRTSVLNQACNSLDRVLEHAAIAGIDCVTSEQFATVVRDDPDQHAGCERLVNLSSRYDSLETATLVSTVLVIFALVITAFPFSSFIHRSSRNLRTLKSDGQKHSPDGTVIRFFIPVINIYKPLIMFVELFKASDPRQDGSDPEQWQKRGIPSPIAVLWALSWAAVVIFNPITAQIVFRTREDLSDVSTVLTGLIVSDILLIVLGVLAILMTNTLSRWQDLKAARHGTVKVTPPRPRDPLEKALEEGVRRNDRDSGSGSGRRSKRRK